VLTTVLFFLSVRTLKKNRSVFRSIWHPIQFWWLSNHLEPLRDLWNGLTFRDQTCMDSGGGHLE